MEKYPGIYVEIRIHVEVLSMCFAVCIPAFAVPIELLPLQNEPTLAGDTDTAYEYPVIPGTKEGDIAVYRDPRSGRIEYAGVVTWLTDEVRVCSKWGRALLMEHPVMECPYAALSVSYDRLYAK